MPMERKTPVAYPDGVYEIAGGDRGNVILIANISQHGLTGLASTRRTALFTFFGKSVCVYCICFFVVSKTCDIIGSRRHLRFGAHDHKHTQLVGLRAFPPENVSELDAVRSLLHKHKSAIYLLFPWEGRTTGPQDYIVTFTNLD